MRFDLVDLRLFLNVAEARSITHGAERSHLALASASARISGMEAALGAALLVRQRRGVTLSPAGECLADHARLILAQVERMKGDLGTFARGLAGTVRLQSNTSALSEHLPRILAAFLKANPAINLDVEERESVAIAEAIASGAADVGIASVAAIPDTLERHPFREDVLVLVVPRGDPLATRRSVDFADVVERAFVGLSRDSALQRHVVSHASRLGAKLAIRARVPGFEAACRMVETGAGIAVVPSIAASRYRRSMEIATVGMRDRWARRSLAICVRQLDTLPVSARRLVDHLKQAASAP
jgi:DNA-binding transcriptional LysR family regulator